MRAFPRTRLSWRSFAILIVVLALYAWPRACAPEGSGAPSGSGPLTPSAAEAAAFDAEIDRLVARQADGVVVEGWATVDRLLEDDLRGSRHQRFIARLSSGRTLLVSHNIDLAPRIDSLRSGDPIRFRGEYVWNSRGGLIHWTHHDPDGRHAGGWIRHASGIFQ